MRKTSILTLFLITFLTLSIRLEIPMIPNVEGSPSMLPSDGDAWTENNNATYPWYNAQGCNETLSFTTTDVKVGSYALNITHTSALTTSLAFLNSSSQDVKDYAFFSIWMKVNNKTSCTTGFIRIWLSEDDGSNWYNLPRYRITSSAKFNTWFKIVMPIRGFLRDNDPTYCQFKYMLIDCGEFGSADNTEILVDGLYFSTTFEYYPTSNQINYNLLPNWIAWTWYNTKVQTYQEKNYTSYYNFVQTDWTHDYETLESELLGELLYALSYVYKLKAYDFVKTRIDDIVTWLLTFQYLNESSVGHGGFYSYYINPNYLGTLKDTFCGWVLAGLSVYYSIDPTSNVKSACDLLRGFLCDTLWDSTNKWFDVEFNVATQNVTDATNWSAMPQGSILAGLGAYQRYISSNSTVKSIVEKCYTSGYNKVKDHSSQAMNRFAIGTYEPTMYFLHGCYQNYKALSNVTFKQEFMNLTNLVFANNMLIQSSSINNAINGSAYAVVKFTSEPYGDERYFDGWGVACSLPLLMWIYDETSNDHILDLVKTILYETFPDGWGLMDFGGFSRFYGDDNVPNVQQWKDQMTVLGNAWIWWSALRWFDFQSISQPYILSTEDYNGITTFSFSSNTLTFTVNGSKDTETSTYIFCRGLGKPKNVEGADDWSWDPSGMLTLTVTHQSPVLISISWKGGSLGLYDLRVHVSENRIPFFGATVCVDGENKTTDLVGDARFQVGYGFHSITVFCGDQTETREILVNADRSVGFNFDVVVHKDRSIYVYIGVPIGVVLIAVVLIFLWRRH